MKMLNKKRDFPPKQYQIMVSSRVLQLNYLHVINPALSVKVLVMDCWLPETLCGLFKTPCCLKETLPVACPPCSGGAFLSGTLKRLAGAGRTSWSSCWAQIAAPCNGRLIVGPSLCPPSQIGFGGLGFLVSAVLLFFVCACQVVPPIQGKELMRNLICHDLVYNTKLGKPFAIGNFCGRKAF